MKQSSFNPMRGRNLTRAIEPLLLLVSAVFLALHALHLSADFPNHSPWMDWAKYTDEGWYGDAAIRYFQRGHWYLPGDFNPAVALPVWPLLEAALFRFTGVNLVAARALTVCIFASILLVSYLLLRRWHGLNTRPGGQITGSLASSVAVLLLSVSPFCFVFTRMAILEPLLILLTLLSLLTASYATPPPTQENRFGLRSVNLRYALPLLALGVLLPLMVLTKTTAVFLLPAIAWLLWARSGYSIRAWLRLSLPPALLGALLWLGYYGLVVRPHFLPDYTYLFSANAYTGINPENALSVLGDTLNDGLWMGKLLYPLGLLAAVSALLVWPRLLRNPLIPALLLWAGGYASFLAYHNNLQPRYYLVIAVPLALLVPVVSESIWSRGQNHRRLPFRHFGKAAIAAALALLIASDARQTLHYVRNPEYSFTAAADRIHSIVVADHTHSPLVLSISGSNLSLMTGLPSICDDFGTMDLAARVQTYRPGWYVTWNHVEDDKMDALAPLYHLQRVADFPALDDPERNLLILYRLDTDSPAAPLPHRRKPALPRMLQMSFGQQPGAARLDP